MLVSFNGILSGVWNGIFNYDYKVGVILVVILIFIIVEGWKREKFVFFYFIVDLNFKLNVVGWIYYCEFVFIRCIYCRLVFK